MSVAKALMVADAVFTCMLLLCHHHHHHILAFSTVHSATASPEASSYVADVAINCGSTGKFIAFDGREWMGDGGGELMPSSRPKGKSKSSTAVLKSFSADPVPYKTSRISATPFYYKFQVSPGQKFIRLHFHPAPYHGFKDSEDLFTVKAGPFTLLSNFSASFAAEALGVSTLVKEFCLNVEENVDLTVTFSPSDSVKSHAFVNGIEIISMPTGLYYTRDDEMGARIVGLPDRFFVIDNSTALELMERLNTGASSISPMEDFGLFRRWNGDANHFIGTKAYRVSHPAHGVIYTSARAYLAPLKVYQTSWKLEPNARVQGVHTFRWKIPLDIGFGYLVRLHFCDSDPSLMPDGGEKEFSVVMNDQVAETLVDLITWSGGSGLPIFRDYMVMMKGEKRGSNADLLIDLRSTNDLVLGLVNGLEIFKLSNPDNSLVAPNQVMQRKISSSWKKTIYALFSLSKGNVIATVTTILLVLVNAIFHHLRQSSEASVHKEELVPVSSIDPSFRCFSLSEILLATQNFSDAFVIGRGGFGKVYKGFISSISQVVAIKRLNANSKQGAREFWAEVETLSKFRHIHLVSLLGYCNESSEMILVYEYMPCGTLADNIYKFAKNGKDSVHLCWEQRLRICIGAARGLAYLHTGTEHGVIHRDVKDTNILLDEKLVAKISDFGLSKLEKFSESKSYMSTKVKGTYGYLDPEYHMTRKLTRKVDVYAFGVVMLVVLSGRPAVDVKNPEDSQSLLSSFRDCIAEGDFEVIVDPSLQGRISPSSLKEFVKSVENCLHHQPKKRPTMVQVATSLERALLEEERPMISVTEVVEEMNHLSGDGDAESMQFSQSPAPPMLEESVQLYPNEPTQGSPLREDSSSVKKSIWGWPWKTNWNRGKTTKKTDAVSSNGSTVGSSVDEQPYQPGPCFSFQDIQEVTDNFRDGFERVDIKGRIACVGFMKQLGKPVIIYEFTSGFDRASTVFKEIEKLLKLRHVNLQPLIGYSLNEHENLEFLVYEHVGFESLDNHIYRRNEKYSPLSWKRRLNICIAVAEGLAYLQKCTGEPKNHHDLELANILLDENWFPKIAHVFNFWLKSVTPDTLHPAMGIMLTPELPSSYKVREDSDLSSLGLLLIEVLFARRINLEDCGGYFTSLRKSIHSRILHVTIDSSLRGKIAAKSLAEYLKTILCCLSASELGISVAAVALKLNFALELQEKAEATMQEDLEQANAGSGSGFSLEDIYREISCLDGFA